MSALVRMHNVDKSYGKVRILHGVSFQVNKGQVVAIIGKSGSGKSTILRCMNRLETIDSGEIEVCGHLLNSPKVNLNALRRDVGIVFQSFNLFPHLTVAENISLAPRIAKNKSKEEALKITQTVLQRVDLLEKSNAYPEQLSGGQQQRVAIARSLAMEPQVMLFDEVTAALDPYLTGEVLSVMEQLALGGMTMILVTHEMAFARKVADQVVFMHEGRVWETGSSDILNCPQTHELKQFVGSEL